jgi:hypothetical protein
MICEIGNSRSGPFRDLIRSTEDGVCTLCRDIYNTIDFKCLRLSHILY